MVMVMMAQLYKDDDMWNKLAKVGQFPLSRFSSRTLQKGLTLWWGRRWWWRLCYYHNDYVMIMTTTMLWLRRHVDCGIYLVGCVEYHHDDDDGWSWDRSSPQSLTDQWPETNWTKWWTMMIIVMSIMLAMRMFLINVITDRQNDHRFLLLLVVVAA